MSTFKLNVSGTTLNGSTNFLNANTTFTAKENFSLEGALVVSNPIDTRGVTGNGVNVLDIGLRIGNPFDGTVRAGETVWASNNALHDEFFATKTGRASLDEVIQSYDAANGILRTVIDSKVASQTNFDQFIMSSSPLTSPRPIIAGEVVLDFSPDGRTVKGSATFIGGSYIQPGTFAETLNFEGILIG